MGLEKLLKSINDYEVNIYNDIREKNKMIYFICFITNDEYMPIKRTDIYTKFMIYSYDVEDINNYINWWNETNGHRYSYMYHFGLDFKPHKDIIIYNSIEHVIVNDDLTDEFHKIFDGMVLGKSDSKQFKIFKKSKTIYGGYNPNHVIDYDKVKNKL